MKRIEEVLEKMSINFKYEERLPYPDEEAWYGLVEFWTDTAGQDIPTEFNFDGTAEDFVEKFTEVAEAYDVDDQVELYVHMRGRGGVPDTVRELLDDCQEVKDTLMDIAERLRDAISPHRKEINTKIFNIRIEVYDGCMEGDIEDAIGDALNNIHCDSTFEITEEEE